MTETKTPWEIVYQGTYEDLARTPVPGGWLYRSTQSDEGCISESMAFVADPDTGSKV